MKYKSILYLKKVIYSGENIGRNFSLSFQLDDQTKNINMALVNGQTRFIKKKLFETFLSRPHKAILSVNVLEMDKYPDEGENTTTITLGSYKRQNTQLSVNVSEIDENGETSSEGTITLFCNEEVYSLDEKKLFIVGEDGWIKGKFYDPETGKILEKEKEAPFPEGLLVKIKDVKFYSSPKGGYIGEEYFEILEGNWSKVKEHRYARLLIPKGVKSRFTNEKSYNPPCKVIFTINGYDEDNNQKGKIDIYINNRIFVKNIYAITNPEYKDNVPPGVYKLEISDAPHPHGITYKDDSKYSTQWFRIDYRKEFGKGFYFHFGNLTDGCITVSKDYNKEAPKIWNKIFETLTWCRAKKGYIGEVEVIDKK